ncbi:hypothetical protein GCM10025865_09310 [Paraoerskovia sediminicola]|uniref:Secreted protein n=1 Tax=Paraoerskovia sediminicola TaxID=1138587 RepID=A0ABM8G145_9CELL|nr:hypothetical protein [Paraoerskovia sediminicola]BDZ41632.1 hypothetical protein GCM10025865_09310 [Paraoerskovia sediminicola]
MTRFDSFTTLLGTASCCALLVSCSTGPDDDARAAFEDRPVLPSCGELNLSQGEEEPASARECLDEAGTAGAELTVTSPTTEGDPITTYFRVGPGIDGMEMWVDATQDAYGSGEWELWRCPETVTAVDPLGCEPAAEPIAAGVG